MYDPERYTHEFNVSIKGLTDEQVYQLNKELKPATKLLIVLFLVLLIVFMFIIYKVILMSPLQTVFVSDGQWGEWDWRWLVLYLPFFIAGFISWKIYKQIGRVCIGSKVQNLKLENLENKVNLLNKQVNPRPIKNPLAPEVQKEVNKIRALGKTK